jgi:hypothetical protein
MLGSGFPLEHPMKRLLTLSLPFLLAVGGIAVGGPAFAESAAPVSHVAAQAGQFDFLLGQWQLTVQPKVNGLVAMIHGVPKMSGSWKAWRAFDGLGIEDELRVIDGSGNPVSLNHAMRVYAAAEDCWKISGLDVYRASFNSSTGHWRGGAMQIDGSGTDHDGKPYLSRTRYINIAADSFTMLQDRSFDNGKTWDEAVLTIDAKRTGKAAA